ncbi:glycoside hydrolase family 48 protein [Tenacibaculum sp. 190524A05c]|uniref:glycoside hydrolase family 48 protein n=1 Tax=Tenacibaculum platacis TaxID=3137852 RepID=UPI0031FB20DF
MKLKLLCVGLLLSLSVNIAAQFNYGEALQKSLYFYEAQQSGELPAWNRVPWRSDSALNDGSDVGLDLTGGWYDAGDHVKFNFPMAYTVTTLAWGGIEFKDAYIQSGQYDILKRNLRFVTDYFLKCHTGPNEYWGQVAAGGIDHAWWGPAEVNPQPRESFKISGANGGSDLAGETAAALAAVSILFQDDDPAYSARLLQSAEELYDYADRVREAYSNSITDAAGFYRSFSNYEDEIVWGAAWLYRATNDNKYLVKAEAEYDNMQREGQSAIAKYKEAFSWDDKAYGTYVLLSILTGKNKYKQDAERNLNWWTGVGVNGDVVPTTPGGLPHIRQWGTLRYANNEAFLALVYSDKVSTNPTQQTAYRNYAKFMTDYTLGDNPINRSFMVGFGNNPANKPHHRGAHGGWTNNCSGVPDTSSHILYGAVVGGPKSPANDGFADDRCEFIANEVACDYNAGITGVLAWMYGNFGGNPLSTFPPASAGTPTRSEVRTMSKFNSNNASGSTVQIRVQNRTAWPARVTDKLSYRYFFDISEGVAQGLTIADYQPTLNAVQGNSSITIGTWDASRNIYYAEVSLAGEQIAPIGDPQFRRETQLNFRVSNGVPYDVTNDWSAQGVGGTEVESSNIPIYDNGVLVFGNEPDAGNAPIAAFTATPESGIAPLDVQFDASSSSDPNGDTLSYSWDFGNGTTSTLVNPLVTYTSVGSYEVSLIVSDGTNFSSPVTKTIEVTDGSPVASFTTTTDSGVAPLTVGFDASSSLDPSGGGLSYSWNFGNGNSASTVTATTVFEVGTYTVSLTVTNAAGQADTVTKVITATDGNISCAFGAPTASALPTIHKQFNHIFVLGSGGPNLDNVTNFTINWDLPNNGLYQFSMLTNNGVPSWWNDFKPKVTQNFNQANPEVNLSNTGFAGLDGDYWVTTDNGNFVMVSKTGGFTIYFSEIDQAPNCNTTTITSRNARMANTCTFNTPVPNALPSIQKQFNNIFVLGSGGPNLDNVSNFTINWDLPNNGLYQFSMLTNNGVPSWWNDLKPKVSQSFNGAQPEVTITNSGFPNLDGSYWATLDGDNFVLVSKTADFTIYFSTTSTEPQCGGGNNNNPIADFTASITSGEAPLLVSFDASNSSDPDSDSLTYTWDFNDGNTATGVMSQNTFTSKGNYSVTLTVDDGKGGTASKSVVIQVSDPVIIVDPGPTGNIYLDRFNEMRAEFYAPENGYFSADGSPHHSIESLIVEAPDHGHESTSELYSYWLWLEVMNARINGDWASIGNVWNKIEEFIIPTKLDQPTNAAYNPSSPAAYASEFPLPENYPAPLEFSAPVGIDPVSAELTAAYGPEVYQMHWLLDNDNFYGYGNRGDGVSTPSYINTFQRGEQESVYETVPHPSWEGFNWGGTNGYLPLFTLDQNYSQQWRYTSATDADARAVQAMYWAQVYAKEQNVSLNTLDLDKATKMGDYLRLGMFDKYFKPLGVQSSTTGAGTGYDSAHYLMSWYISWGGAVDTSAPWAFRISSSHCHFGYQNPVAAYAMSQVNELKPTTPNGARDWGVSLQRQLEFYTWLQSKEGGIAGGATNSWNGNYSTYPAGKSTFYDMAFNENPVYLDPGSGTWFGWQAWSMERIAEYYYITNDVMAKNLMDKWANWVKSIVVLIGEDDFDIPATLAWTGEPDTWDPDNPGTNQGLSVTVTEYGKDLGVAASMAKALIYYAAATEKYETLDTASRDLAKEVLDRMWRTYRDDKGVSAPESRGDFSRIFEQEVFVPEGFNGTMPNGDVIQPGVTFLDIRSDYRNDPDFPALEQAYNSGTEYTKRYHRSWAQIEVALANAEYGFFFGNTAARSSKTIEQKMLVGIGPNPVSEQLNIYISHQEDEVELNLIDVSGRIVRSKKLLNGNHSTTLSVSNLPVGLYILEAKDKLLKTINRKKIIVTR